MIVNIIEKDYLGCRFKDVWSGLASQYAVDRLLRYFDLDELKGQLQMIEKINVDELGGCRYTKYILKGNQDEVLAIENDFAFLSPLKLENIQQSVELMDSYKDFNLTSLFEDLIDIEVIYSKLILLWII